MVVPKNAEFARQLVVSVVLCLCASLSMLHGGEVAGVKSELKTESPVCVGQEVSFFVELMSSTFFSGTPQFDVPEIPGAFIMKDEGRPVMGSERIDGQTWSTQRHHFRAFPQRAGEFTIPPFGVRFDVAPAFGKPPESQNLKTDALTFESRLPPGAEGLSLLISTKNLEVNEDWSPAVTDGKLQLEVGDALTRRITLLAKDVPGMALPAITMPEPQGMSAYPAKPFVEDRADRGLLTGVRNDSVTFVCEQPGVSVLPAITISWWDIDANELKKVTLPSVTVSVSESTSTVDEGDIDPPPASSASSRLPLIGLAIIGGLVALATWFRNPIATILVTWRTRLAVWKSRMEASEPACFARLRRACRSNDPIAAHNALMHWLERRTKDAELTTIQSLIDQGDDAQLSGELTSLEMAVAKRTPGWSGSQLLTGLSRHRLASLRRRRLLAAEDSLPPLNP